VFNVALAAQRVALAALRAPAAWIDEARREYRGARDATLHALDGSGLRVFSPEGGSYVFVDFSPILDGRPIRDLLEHAIDRGVVLAPGEGFGDAFGSWARLCFTSERPARVLEGVARLRAAMDGLARGRSAGR
jgi:aspartate/methionine/tyrosine aminotransferase